MNHHQKQFFTSWRNECATNIEIRETYKKDEGTSEKVSDFANQMNHLTLDLEAEIYMFQLSQIHV